MEIVNQREAHYDIDPMYINRWSPRSFSNQPIEDDKLNSVFEAARWAPSASNWQPWRFIIAKTPEDRKKFLSFINEYNEVWCKRAPVLALIISKKARNEKGDPNPYHSFDTGTAWGYLTLEAARQGLITHGMGGFDAEKARETLDIPETYAVQAVFAIGYHDPEAPLSAQLKEREIPSNRNPITDFVFEGKYTE